MKETAVGAAVVALLAERGFSVYQEVLCAWGSILDLAATKGPLLIAVECKVSLTFEVMHQAMRWIPHAHHSYVATPLPRFGIDPLQTRLLEDLGLGFIGVRDASQVRLVNGVPEDGSDGGARAEFLLDPRWNRRANDGLRKTLREEHKTYAPAGSSGAARWSPFKATVQELARFVDAHPGCTLKAAIDGIRHHYSSKRNAMSSLVHWIDAGSVAGVRVERESGRLLLYPAAPARRSA